jgi:DNA repair exonuclease SbcCD ATPase subunit
MDGATDHAETNAKSRRWTRQRKRRKAMSIVQSKNKYTATCDVCGTELKEEHDFYDAVDAKKKAGWKSQKIDGEWCDFCTDCKEASE